MRERAVDIAAILLSAAAVAAFAPDARAQSTATTTYTIPGTVNASGLNGTRFVSDVAITNPGAAPAIAILTLVPANGTSQSLQFLAPGQTLVVRNVLQQLWGASGAAATVVNSTAPLLIRARTYNTAASGTYGVALPVVPADRMLGPGPAADSLWISQSADGSTGYRTNVAVVFPGSSGGDATVTVYDEGGNAMGSQAYSLASAGFQQFSVGAFAGAVAVGRAEIVVTRGRAAAYTVVVDNVTGDSSLFAFEDLPAGRQDVLANGVARANGRNATFFRTDARIYNPTAADASVTVSFHANQNANPSPQTATFVVPAGKIRDVVDVLASLLSLPVGSAGALRFTSESPIAILCRTSNVDPSGSNPGTFGAQQKPTPVLSFLTSADAGGVVTGVRQGAAFRTNVGFAAGGDGASYDLTLKGASGVTVGTASGSLGPWGWAQPNVQDLFSGVTVPDDALLQVNVRNGSLDVFDSSIDNASGDPVVTPVMALPSVIPSAATLGPSGGAVQSSDGRLTLKIPAGALAAATLFQIAPAASAPPNPVGTAYTITPGGALARPALLVFTYSTRDVNGTDPAYLLPALRQGTDWFPAASWSIDPGRRTVTAALPGLSASVRRAEAGGGGMDAGLVTEFFITGNSVVSPSGGAIFHVSFTQRDPNKPGGPLEPNDLLSGQLIGWKVNDQLGGDGTYGRLRPIPPAPEADYTAPACVPRANYVEIKATYGDWKARHWVSIFPITWTYTVSEYDQAICHGGAEGTPTVSYGGRDELVVYFSINKLSGEIEDVVQTHTNTTVQMDPDKHSCIIEKADCETEVTSPASQLFLQSLSGSVDMGTMQMTIEYLRLGRPGFQVTCKDGSGPVAGMPGKTDTSNPSLIEYMGETPPPKVDSVGGFFQTLNFSAKPRDPACGQ